MTFWACGDGGFPDICIPRVCDKEVGCGTHGLEMREDLGGGAPKDFRLASSPCGGEFLKFEFRVRGVGLFLDGELSPFHDEVMETGSLGETFGDDPGLKELGGVCRGGEPTCPKGFFASGLCDRISGGTRCLPCPACADCDFGGVSVGLLDGELSRELLVLETFGVESAPASESKLRPPVLRPRWSGIRLRGSELLEGAECSQPEGAPSPPNLDCAALLLRVKLGAGVCPGVPPRSTALESGSAGAGTSTDDSSRAGTFALRPLPSNPGLPGRWALTVDAEKVLIFFSSSCRSRSNLFNAASDTFFSVSTLSFSSSMDLRDSSCSRFCSSTSRFLASTLIFSA
mmetsp:Transcript_37913/g.100991  ORF Transcript_37913/g.100991 Transcript_37913/m.100991 type:complete len:343 (+) Transcript_37913:579-1607(+)